MTSKMKLTMEGWLTGEVIGGWPILVLIGEEDFFSSHDSKRDYSSPNEYRMKIEISFFSENIDIKSFLDWVYEVEKFLGMAYVPTEKHVKFMAYKLKGGAVAWWHQLQITRRRKPPAMTWRRMEQLLKGKLLHSIINKSFTINLNTANKVQGLLRYTRRSSTASHHDVIYQ